MTLPRQPIRRVNDLLAFAAATSRDLAALYRSFARVASEKEEAALAQQFDALAEAEEREGEDLVGRGALPDRLGGFKSPDDSEARAALADRYQALAFAVRNAERSFATYAYVSAHAEDEATRRLAEDLARAKLRQASALRVLRRRAYRDDRPVATPIPPDVASLREVVRRWESQAGAAHSLLAEELARTGKRASADIMRRVAAEEQGAGAPPVATPPPPVLHTIADGTRILEDMFDRLALIGDRAKHPDVVVEAQRFAERIVARLALVAAAEADNATQAAGRDRAEFVRRGGAV